jgi:agmatine deiminase
MIYFSSLLLKRFPNLLKQLTDSGLKFELLFHTKDIWARDYMPVGSGNGNYVQFDYHPSYLKDYDTIRTNANNCSPKHINVQQSSLIVDGGNVVYNNKYVVLTDTVYLENNGLSKAEAVMELQRCFPSKKIIIIPTEIGDLFGHADGMLRFVNDNTVLVNNYYQLGYTTAFINELFGKLKKEGLKILLCPYLPEDRITTYGVPSANGNYINYLQTVDSIYLPQFNIDTDIIAYNFFVTNFAKTIVPIDCEELAEYGGLLNCISWS